jgi:predicted dienelactone hydrolase
MSKLRRRLWTTALAGATSVGFCGAVLIGALWSEHRSGITLPDPTGPHRVGRIHATWTVGTSAAGAHPLLVWIWYPAAGQPDRSVTNDYLPAHMCAGVMHARGWLLGGLLTRDLSRVRCHAADAAPPAPEPRRFPVLLLRGGASAAVWNYTTLAEDLASHGYVVVGFDVPHRTNVVVMADGTIATRTPENDPEAAADRRDNPTLQRLIDEWSRDMSFAVDELAKLNASDPMGRFQGRLDLHRVGAFGHSFGGTEAAAFCVSDPRCRAGVDIDGGMFANTVNATIKQPFMFLLGDHRRERGQEVEEISRGIQAVYDRLPADTRAFVTLPDANHFFFSDDGALLKSHLIITVLRWFGVVRTDGPRQLAVTASVVRSFFDTHLNETRRAAPPPP